MMNSQQFGFTLIELMVTMAIATVAMLGVSKLYINSAQTSRIQISQSRLTEDGRYAIGMLKKVVTQAGYRNVTDKVFDGIFKTAKKNEMKFTFMSDGTNLISCPGSVYPDTGKEIVMTISKAGGGLRCNSNLPALDVDWLDGTASSVVEDLSFEYGIDNSIPVMSPEMNSYFLCRESAPKRDCVADEYIAEPVGDNNKYIVSVRVCLLLRGALIQHENVEKAVPDTMCDGKAVKTAEKDRYFFRKFTTTIALRNL